MLGSIAWVLYTFLRYVNQKNYTVASTKTPDVCLVIFIKQPLPQQDWSSYLVLYILHCLVHKQVKFYTNFCNDLVNRNYSTRTETLSHNRVNLWVLTFPWITGIFYTHAILLLSTTLLLIFSLLLICLRFSPRKKKKKALILISTINYH